MTATRIARQRRSAASELGFGCILVLGLAQPVAAQLDFALGFGNTGQESSGAVVADVAGNIHVTGSFENTVDFDPGAGVTNLTSAGSKDIFVAKYDPTGSLVFAFGLGSTSVDFGLDLAIDASGNIYVTGRFAGTVDFDPGAGVTNLTSAGDRDAFVARYDPTGNLDFALALCGTGFDGSQGIAVDASGNIYVTGDFVGTADFDPGPGVVNLTSAGASDIFLAKYDAAGSLDFAFGVGGTNLEEGQGVAVDTFGNMYVTGVFRGTADIDPGAGVTNLTSVGSNNDLFIGKFDAPVLNVTQGTLHDTLAEAIVGAVDDDELSVPADDFDEETTIDFARKSLTMRSTGAIDQPVAGVIVLADGALLAAATGEDITLNGELRTDVECDTLHVAATGELVAEAASVLDVSSATVNDGRVKIQDAVLASSVITNNADFQLLDGSVQADTVTNNGSGVLLGWGSIFADVTNNGTATFVLDAQVAGDYTNNGDTTIQSGQLTITGSLTDNGVLSGNVNASGAGAGPPPEEEPENGLTVIGDYIAAAGVSLLIP
jgi:hypothetical protein